MFRRDRAALFLAFLLPIIFFSIFVVIFGSTASSSSTDPISCIVVDLDASDSSKRFIQALRQDPGLTIYTASTSPPFEPFTRDSASQLVKSGDVRVAAVLPHGFGDSVGSFSGDAAPVELLTDATADPVAHQVVNGLMQRALIAGAPDIMIQRGLDQFERFAGGLTPSQRKAMDTFLPLLRQQSVSDSAPASQPGSSSRPSTAGESAAAAQHSISAAPFSGGLISTQVVNVRTETQSEWKALVAFQAAATAVMFLLFAVSAGGGSLLEEQESGVLDRLLISSLGMSRLLLGKWLFISIMGFVQVSIMFVWGALVFGLDLFTTRHLAGFLVMTALTAAAAASLGILLATICKSRSQLAGLSTIVVLIMSAVGGSMFPRFLMPQTLQLVGKFCTFNAWALDGYRKIFYYDLSLAAIWPEFLVLALATIVFLVLARVFARRWEVI